MAVTCLATAALKTTAKLVGKRNSAIYLKKKKSLSDFQRRIIFVYMKVRVQQQNSPTGAGRDSCLSTDRSLDLMSRVTVAITGARTLTSLCIMLHADACHASCIFLTAQIVSYIAVSLRKSKTDSISEASSFLLIEEEIALRIGNLHRYKILGHWCWCSYCMLI